MYTLVSMVFFNLIQLVFFLDSISLCLPGCLQTVFLCQAPKYGIIGLYHYALCSILLCLIITWWLGIVKWPAHFFLVKLLNHTYKLCQLVLFVVLQNLTFVVEFHYLALSNFHKLLLFWKFCPKIPKLCWISLTTKRMLI